MSKTAFALYNTIRERFNLSSNSSAGKNLDISRFTPEYIDQIASGEIDRKYCVLNSSDATLIKLDELTRFSNKKNYLDFPYIFNSTNKVDFYNNPGNSDGFSKILKSLNLYICGGCFSVTHREDVNDYDLFLVDPNPNKIKKETLFISTINKFIKNLLQEKYQILKIIYNVNTVTFVTIFMGSKFIFQLILKRFNTIAEVLYSFDLPVSQVAYDGQNYYLTDGAFLTYSTNVLPVIFDKVRCSFLHRLEKYFNRGFSLWFPNCDVDPNIKIYSCECCDMVKTNLNNTHYFQINNEKLSEYENYGSYGPTMKLDYLDNQSIYEWNTHMPQKKYQYKILYDAKIMKKKLNVENFDLIEFISFKLVQYIKTLPINELFEPNNFSDLTYLVNGEKMIIQEEPTDFLLNKTNDINHYQNIYIKLMAKEKLIYDQIEHLEDETLEEEITKMNVYIQNNPKYRDLGTSIYKCVDMLKKGSIYLIRREKFMKFYIRENNSEEDIQIGFSILDTKITKEDFKFIENDD